jgi:HEAT repeat protein
VRPYNAKTVLCLALAMLALAASSAKETHSIRETPLSFTNGTIVLRGTLMWPEPARTHPTLVLVHGSGAANRKTFVFAPTLVQAGIPVFAYDKRGVGESGGDWTKSSIADLASDVVAGVGNNYEARTYAIEQLQTAEPVAVSFIIEALEGQTNSLRNRLNAQWTKVYLKLPPAIRRIAPKPRMRFFVEPKLWLQALIEIGPRNERVIPALTKQLNHRDSEVRFFATHSLALVVTNWLGHPNIGRQIIGALTDKLKDPAGNVRGAAVVGLGRSGATAEPHLPELVNRLSDSDEDVRMHAVRALVNIDARTNLILPHLNKLIGDADPGVRAYAAYTRWKLTGDQGTNLLVLRQVLHGQVEDRQRGLAAGYLGLLGQQALGAVPDLNKAIADPELQVSLPAAKALWRITGETEPAVTLFKRALAEGEGGDRSYSLEALMLVGLAAETALPEIIDALAAREFYVRKAAARAAGALGPNARAALPELKKLLNDQLPSVRAEAATAIKAIELNDTW